MSDHQKDTGKVLKFEKSAEYHFRRYQKHIDSGNYIDSLVALRDAVKKDPDNFEYLISLAELYTEMEHFSESNAILFDLFLRNFDADGDAVFGLGCNFLGLQDYDKACECFEKYMYKYPNGEFFFDAKDMLDYISDEEFEEDAFDIPKEAVLLSNKGKYLLDSGQYEAAAEILEQLSKDYPEQTFIKNNLALAYYCNDQRQKAITLSLNVLSIDPNNVHAICNLVLFYRSAGDKKSVRKYIALMDNLHPEDGDEILKIMVTCCESGEHEKAYSMIHTLLDVQPYSTKAMFLCAVVSANTGRLEESLEILTDILRIDPDDTISAYYKNAVSDAVKMGKETMSIPYVYQVPAEEIKERLFYLNECMSLAYEDLYSLWTKQESYLRKILLWGLELSDVNIKKICLEILFSFHDSEAIRVLKRFLLTETAPDSLKNEIFLMFNSLSVPQPYVAYISGKIAEVRVGSIENRNGLSKCHEELLSHILSSPYAETNKGLITMSIAALNRYFSSFERAPVVKNYSAWATALMYFAMNESRPDLIPSIDTMCRDMNADKKAVLRCVRLLNQKLKK